MSKLIHTYPNHVITKDTNWTITNYQTINYNIFQYPTHRHKNVKGVLPDSDSDKILYRKYLRAYYSLNE